MARDDPHKLPSNVELEATVLGAMLADNATIDVVGDLLTSQDFHEPLHERIFQAISHQYAKDGVSSPITLLPLFKDDPAIADLGGAKYLAQLSATPSGLLDPQGFAKQLAKIGRRRRLASGLKDALAATLDPNCKVDEAIGLADEAMAERSQATIEENSAGYFFDQMIAANQEGLVGVSCGRIPSLDEVLGKLPPGSMTVLAGRPGMGKSGVAISYAIGAAQRGHGVLLCSLEMLGPELAQRFASDICYDQPNVSVPYADIVEGDLGWEQAEQIDIARKKASDLPLTLAAGTGLTVGRLAASVRRNKRRMEAAGHKLELVIIDYLQLLRTDVRLKSEYETVSEISRSLKEIALANQIAIMPLSQLNRSVEQRDDKRPNLSDLRASGQIEQDADNVAFLLRREYYMENEKPPKNDEAYADWNCALAECKNQIEFIGGKRRRGRVVSRTGKFFAEFQAVRG